MTARIVPIPSAPGYLAGDDGRIYSVRGRWRQPDDPPEPLQPGRQTNNYQNVCLANGDGTYRMARVHQLVCEVKAEKK